MKIRLDADACTGHGRCYALAPEVFGADDLGHCEVLDDAPTGDVAARARRAVASCPELALTLDD